MCFVELFANILFATFRGNTLRIWLFQDRKQYLMCESSFILGLNDESTFIPVSRFQTSLRELDVVTMAATVVVSHLSIFPLGIPGQNPNKTEKRQILWDAEFPLFFP